MSTPSETTSSGLAAAGEPAWRAAVAGWLVAHAIAGALPDRAPQALDPCRSGPESAFAPRILRGWPGIGEVRALAIVRARWEHPDQGPPLYLSDVEGIGEATERDVRAWLGPENTLPTVRAGRRADAGSGPTGPAVHSPPPRGLALVPSDL